MIFKVPYSEDLYLFPAEYAYTFLGFSKSALKHGKKLPLLGIGGVSKIAYGVTCNIQHPEFSIKDVYIYFLENQPFPLLGRVGFMDRFKYINFNEAEKEMEFSI